MTSTTRPFGDADRAKKMKRMKSDAGSQAHPEALAGLRGAVKESLHDGYLQCATAFGISKRLGVPLVAVGNAADDLGIRVVDCQLGCFKVDKAVHHPGGKKLDPAAVEGLEDLAKTGPLACAAVFALARRLNLRPLDVAGAANARHIKIHNCQLGCF
ncbi:MAG: hypothetical protein HYY32_04250 [Chloroflexi bacterium]|nr:hypothetical protein [Chloroflexota bacterium]